MENGKETKECRNCVHYRPYYIKIGNIKFHRLAHGYCPNAKKKGRRRDEDMICECFEQRDILIEKDETVKAAIKSISSIAEQINELAQILKELDEKT